jgi:MoaA/NifB/PqqE/SkfB family radical SAM enzyme
MKKTKAYLNVLKLRLNMRLKREVVHNYPVAAFIEPDSFCNLRCPACPTGLRLGLRPPASIKEELFRSAIDEIGDYIFQLFMYNWGEPLLHRQTPELIRYAKERDINIILSTNLSLNLTDEYVERLVRSGLDVLSVSVDGTTEQTYEKYRRGGNLALVRKNLLRIKRAKERLGLQTPKVIWQFIVFRHNEHEIAQALREYREWGADQLVLATAMMPLEPYNEGFQPSTIPQYNMYRLDHPIQIRSERQMKSRRPCSWLYGFFVLNPNGKVSPCCEVPSEKHDFGEYSIGRGFFEVWNSDQFRRARRLFLSTGRKPSNSFSHEEKLAISKRIDGCALRATQSLAEGELICQKCPIPHGQNYVDSIIARVVGNMLRSFLQDASLRKKAECFLNYLLMGAPNWQRARAIFSRREETQA